MDCPKFILKTEYNVKINNHNVTHMFLQRNISSVKYHESQILVCFCIKYKWIKILNKAYSVLFTDDTHNMT